MLRAALRPPMHWHDLALAAFDQTADVVIPHCQRVVNFAFITRPVVDPADAATVPAPVVEDLLDNVWGNTDVGHLRDGGSSQVVQHPWLYLIAEPSVE